MKNIINYFSKFELTLLISSYTLIILSFIIFDRTNYLSLVSSLFGVTSPSFIAKGNPIGQIIGIIFSILYGIISFSYAYYGEMITYIFMTGPMEIIALVSWLKNPSKHSKSEFKIGSIKSREIFLIAILATIVTTVFYFSLKYFDTTNLLISTFSITTSFVAVYLTFRRSPYYAIAYAINDIVLIVLWILATIENITYVSVIICFAVFLANDIYAFINWHKMKKNQVLGKNKIILD